MSTGRPQVSTDQGGQLTTGELMCHPQGVECGRISLFLNIFLDSFARTKDVRECYDSSTHTNQMTT